MADDHQPDQVIEVHYTPTFDDYLAFNQQVMRHKAKPTRWWLLLILTAVITVCMLLSIDTLSWDALRVRGPVIVMLLCFAGSLIYWRFLGMRRLIGRAWQRASQLHEPRTYRFHDRGFQVMGETFETTLVWRHIQSAEHDGELLILGTGQHLFHFVPLRAFSTQADLEHLIQILERAVPNAQVAR